MKLFKISAIVLGTAVVITLTGGFLLPSILSTSTGKTWALDLANQRIPGRIDVSEMNLNWFSPSRLKNVSLFDKEGKLIASIDQVDLNNTLWKLLTSSRPRPTAEVTNLNAVIIADEKGTTNFESALFFDKELSSNRLSPIELKNTNLKTELNGKTVHLVAVGNTLQGQTQGSFNVAGDFGNEVEADFKVTDFPSAIFDQIVSFSEPKMKGLLKELLGQQFSINGSSHGNTWVFELKSGNLKGSGEGKIHSDDWLFTKPLSFEFRMTPEAFKILSQNGTALQKTGQVEIDIDNWNVQNQWLKGKIALSDFAFEKLLLNNTTIDLSPSEIKVAGLGPDIQFGLDIVKDHEESIVKWKKWLDQSGKISLFVKGLLADVQGSGNFNQDSVDLTLNGKISNLQMEDLKIAAQGLAWDEISNLDSLKITGDLFAKRISQDQFTLLNVTMPWEFDGRDRSAKATVSALLDKNSPLKGEFNFAKGVLKYKSDIRDFPLASLPLPEHPLFKTQALITTEGEITKDGNGYANSKFKTVDLDLSAKLLVQNFNQVQLNGEPIVLNFHLSPERFKTISQNRLESSENFTGSFIVDTLNLKDPVTQSKVKMQMVIAPFTLKNPSDGRKIISRGLNGQISSESLSEKIDFYVREAEGAGFLNVNGSIVDVFKTPSIDFNLKADSFPTPFIAALLPPEADLGRKVDALLGSTFTANIQAKMTKMSGPIVASIKGARSELNLEGGISGGYLTLSKPLLAMMTVTPEISDVILDDFVPILNSAIRADQPIKLTISPQGFRLPLRDFSISNTSIDQATLDLGRIYFNRNGNLAEILSLLNISAGPEFSVWFTPLYFNLQEGVFNMARVDLLIADNYPVASWGSVNFPQDSVNMYVGLTGKALSNTFGGIMLPRNYMMAMPLRGPVSNPRLDTTKVAARMASMAAMVAGPQGLLLGALMELALNDKVPAPSTNPLPWETDSPQSENTTENSNNPARSIQKGAKKLIDNFFGS